MTEILQVNQEWLKWARKSLHYSQQQVSDKLRIKKERINEWETTGQIPYDKLEKISKIYDVTSLTFLTRDAPPKITEDIPDFRTKKNKKADKTPEILKEINHVKNKREIILELSEELNINHQTVKQINSDKKEEFIQYITKNLEINNATLQTYKIDDWIRTFEKKGILVFQFYNIPLEDIRGYAFYYEQLPIIGINHQDNPRAKIFTLFHEYVHILFGKDGISGDFLVEPKEVFCNRIAAQILLPKSGVKTIWNNSNQPLKNKINIIQKHFNVSKTAILYRLLNLNIITEEEKDSYINNTPPVKHKTFKNIKTKRQKNKNKTQNKKLATEIINKNGYTYINTLLQAKNEQIITNVEFARDLNVAHNLIPYIADKIVGDHQ